MRAIDGYRCDHFVDPQVSLTDGLGRIAEHKITRLDELLPWHYIQRVRAYAFVKNRCWQRTEFAYQCEKPSTRI